MNPAEITREDAATRAFLEPQENHIGGVLIRAITLETLALLQQSRNEFLTPRGPVREDGKPSLENELFAALAFAYLHAAPAEEVRRAVWSESFFREQVLAFGAQFAPGDLPRLVGIIQDRLAAIKALEFSIARKPEDRPAGGPAPPPNS